MEDRNFEEIYNEYAEAIFQYAYKILKDKNLAKDVVAETFVRFSKFYNSIANNATLKWLIITAKNITIDILRDKNKTLPINNNSQFVSNSKDLFEVYLIKSDYEKINEIIKKLPKSLLEIYELYFVKEYSPKEIANMKNLTLNNVNKKIFKIRSFIFKRLPKEIKERYFKKEEKDE